MRTSLTVRSIWAGSCVNPGAMSWVRGLAKMIAARVMNPRISTSHMKAERVMAKAASSPFFWRRSENTGTNAMVMEPSAKRRRRVLGRR